MPNRPKLTLNKILLVIHYKREKMGNPGYPSHGTVKAKQLGGNEGGISNIEKYSLKVAGDDGYIQVEDYDCWLHYDDSANNGQVDMPCSPIDKKLPVFLDLVLNGAVHSIATTNLDPNKSMSLFRQTQAQCNRIVCGDVVSLLPKEGSDQWKQLAAEGLKLKKQFQDREGAVANTNQVSISREDFESFKEKYAKNSKTFQDFMVSVDERFTVVETNLDRLRSEFDEFKSTVANTGPLVVDPNAAPPAVDPNPAPPAVDPNPAPPANVDDPLDRNAAPPADPLANAEVDPLADVDPNAARPAEVDPNAAPPAEVDDPNAAPPAEDPLVAPPADPLANVDQNEAEVDPLANVEPNVEPNLDQSASRTKSKLFVVVLLLALVGLVYVYQEMALPPMGTDDCVGTNNHCLDYNSIFDTMSNLPFKMALMEDGDDGIIQSHPPSRPATVVGNIVVSFLKQDIKNVHFIAVVKGCIKGSVSSIKRCVKGGVPTIKGCVKGGASSIKGGVSTIKRGASSIMDGIKGYIESGVVGNWWGK